MNARPDAASVRRRIRVRGVVQGVGFRPFVYRTATELGLAGSVCNDGAGVEIDVQGPAGAVEALLERLRRSPPPLARVDAVEIETAEPQAGLTGFAVADSHATRTDTAIGHDTATCAACLEDLFDPAGRRWRYAFTNCTDCGPRYTVTRALPYDRPQTSLAPFPLCADCAREYALPGDRRFHAEASACPACGPRLVLERGAGAEPRVDPTADPVAGALELLAAGAIVAIKGLGGFHLACDARNAAAVARLRARKQREEQPLAIMALNTRSLEPLVEVSRAERTLLESRERPIVLLRRQPESLAALPGVADGHAWLGVMLPYAPVHWLLWHEAAGRPAGTRWLARHADLLLVMTSANPHGEPLVVDDAEARERLAGLADALLLHDRAIVARCDDSVMRVRGGRARFVRRARGAAPRAVRLADERAPVLAVGGHYKVTACVTRGAEAFLSPHVGDLDAPATRRALDGAVQHLLRLVDVRPTAIAHDLHPDFHGTQLAGRLAAELDVPLVAVQHHHAHVAAVLAEHHVETPTLGLALDGVGYGTDGRAWGGELLLVDGARFERLGHLRPLPLPGGDRAVREPWRMGAAVLHALGRGAEIPIRYAAQPGAEAVRQLLERSRSPTTTSLGRWFDAAAGLLGVKPVMSFEGQAAMLLEGLAGAAGEALPPAGRHALAADGVLDLLPLLAAIADASDPIAAAARFHRGLALALADWVEAAARRHGLARVACGGGCFLNDILARTLRAELESRGLAMLEAEAVPPNDGGLSLGQAWIAQRQRGIAQRQTGIAQRQTGIAQRQENVVHSRAPGAPTPER